MLLSTFIAFTMTNPSFVVRQIFEMDNLTNNCGNVRPYLWNRPPATGYGIYFSGVLLYMYQNRV